MKRTFLITGIWFVCYTLLFGQTSLDLKDIQGLEVDGKILMQIKRSDDVSLVIDYAGMDSACVQSNIQDGILYIGISKPWRCRKTAMITLSVPSLTYIGVNGGADVSSANVLTGNKLTINVSNNSRAHVDMDITELEANITSGGILSGEGYAIRQVINASLSSTYSGLLIEGEEVKADATSNSIVKVYATKKIEAQAGAGAYLSYKGNPAEKDLDPMTNGTIEAVKD